MKVLFFSTARGLAGCASDDLPITKPATAPEVWAGLLARHPRLAPLRDVARLSRNDEYANAGDMFQDGDVVGVIPPVSGG